ncbi:Glutaredoxin-2 [Vanrija pseudolonga]|uniref:Glutaredoxin-2 n=1 Tax=Vanrija pseudolonga TaxID=143232 RepID=A0AAF1BK56_9TREE|nr:Glutaredoxin-2 [Vanrija pseudolonga]
MFTAARRVNVLAAHLSRTTPIAARTPTTGSTFKVGSFFSTPAVTPAAMSAAKELVDKAIAENHVVVFSKSYCPYCRRSKATLADLTEEIKVFELDERDDGSAIQAYLRELNGQSTVPHVYIGQQFIGGNSDLQAIPKPELEKRIKA